MTDAAARSLPTPTPTGSARSSVDADELRLPAEWGSVLDVLIDDQRVWSLTPARDAASGGRTRRVPWPQPLRRYLDGAARVTIREHVSGRVLFDEECRFGSADTRVRVVDAAGWPLALDKGGQLQRCFDGGSAAMVGSLLDSVEELLAVVRDHCGLPAFLSFGALLGAVREGALLGHDSDADVSYLSAYEHPTDVARESYGIERTFHRHGYTTLRFSAADFKVLVGNADGGTLGIDVFGGFVVEDWLYVLPNVRAKLPRSAIVPLGEVELEGRRLPAPADPPALLAATYGESWRVPDPSFHFEVPEETKRRLNGWLRGNIAHRPHWDQFYRGPAAAAVPTEPSAFARWVGERESASTALVDIGSGNGRDAVWFARQGYRVTGFDYSGPALRQSRAAAKSAGVSATFEAVNLYDLRYVLATGARLAHEDGPRALYARFLPHALEDVGRHQLWRLARMALRPGGRLYLEFRTRKDARKPHEFGKHFRRFLKPDTVVRELEARGGHVEHREEGHGLAVYRDEDPHVCRIVARWDP